MSVLDLPDDFDSGDVTVYAQELDNEGNVLKETICFSSNVTFEKRPFESTKIRLSLKQSLSCNEISSILSASKSY